jgi:hypothetical protein
MTLHKKLSARSDVHLYPQQHAQNRNVSPDATGNIGVFGMNQDRMHGMFTHRGGGSSSAHRPHLVRALLIMMFMAMTALPGLASAAVPGLQRVPSSVTTGSAPTQSAVATCPSGMKVIGTGGTANGPAGKVVLRRVIPNATLTSVTATGAEIGGGTTNNWSVQAFAVCATSSAVPGLQLFQLNSESDSDNVKAVNVNCPTGKQLLGTGGALFGPTDKLVLFGMTPNGARTGAVVIATEIDNGITDNWFARVYAICANALPGYEHAVKNSTRASTPTQTATVPAPAGTKIIGAGGTVNGQTTRIALTAFVPAADLLSVEAKGAEVGSGLTTTWSVGAYAIGATP